MKKGTIQTIIIVVILAVVFVLLAMIFLLPSGLIQTAAEKSSLILTYLPGREVRTPGTTEITAPTEVGNSFNKLIDTIRKNKDKPGPCFVVDYPSLSDLGDYQIQLDFLGDKTVFKLYDAKKQQVVGETKEIFGYKPCVVAGVYSPMPGATPLADGESIFIAENFYKNYLQGTPSRLYQHDFYEVTKIVLSKTKIKWESQESDREDDQLLYVPEKGRVCFIATFGDNDYYTFGVYQPCNKGDGRGVDEDCLDDPDELEKFKQKSC